MKLSEANQYDARIAPMLTAALQDEQLLTSNLAYFVYTYGIPTSRGLGSPTSPLPAKKTFWDEQLQMRQLEIANALKQAGQVGAKLNKEQRALIEHYSAQVRP